MRKAVDQKQIDLSKKLLPYEGQWVALSLDHVRVLGSGKTLQKAKQEAEEKSKQYTLVKLPPYDVNYIPAF